MVHRGAHAVVVLALTALFSALWLASLAAQPAPRQFFFVCTAQAAPSAPGGMMTFYLSGVLQGQATAAQAFRTDFAQFLMQRYSFKGAAACAPAATEALAQNALTQRAAVLKNNPKLNVVETGWTEGAPAAAASASNANPAATRAASAGAPAAPRAAPANAASTGTAGARGAGNTSAGGRGQGQAEASAPAKNDTATEVASVIGAIFGTNNGGNGNASGGKAGTSTAGGGRQGQAASGRGSTGGRNDGGTANAQSPASQLSGTLTSAFNSKPSNTNARGAQPSTPNGALGSAQSGTTKLVVYGCGRQGEQIACVADLTNENAKDSLVQSGDVWKDAFLVDDRGDRHQRTNGFFLNIDGEQRQQLDISLGKSAKFILMFDNVQARVQKVSLRAPSAGLDVEDIGLVSADGGQH